MLVQARSLSIIINAPTFITITSDTNEETNKEMKKRSETNKKKKEKKKKKEEEEEEKKCEESMRDIAESTQKMCVTL